MLFCVTNLSILRLYRVLWEISHNKRHSVAFGGLAVIVLTIGSKARGFKPGDGFLRAIKIRSTTSLGGEVQPSAPCRKILQDVKETQWY
jgi:hypothetical protein